MKIPPPVFPPDKPEHRSTRCLNSWARKRAYKKKLVRQFLSINPAMDFSKFGGTGRGSAIYCWFAGYENGEFYDPRMEYCFNPYYSVYLSRRGDLRKFAGQNSYCRGGYTLFHTGRDGSKGRA